MKYSASPSVTGSSLAVAAVGFGRGHRAQRLGVLQLIAAACLISSVIAQDSAEAPMSPASSESATPSGSTSASATASSSSSPSASASPSASPSPSPSASPSSTPSASPFFTPSYNALPSDVKAAPNISVIQPQAGVPISVRAGARMQVSWTTAADCNWLHDDLGTTVIVMLAAEPENSPLTSSAGAGQLSLPITVSRITGRAE